MDAAEWMDRARSAEAKYETCRQQQDRVIEDSRAVLSTLCAKKKSDGTIDIDFDALVQKLSTEHALEFRAAIDQHHRISGAPGEKPRISITPAQEQLEV